MSSTPARRSIDWCAIFSLAEPSWRNAAGATSPISSPRIASTTSSSSSVKPRCRLLQPAAGQAVVLADPVVVRPVLKGQREQALLLQIGFVNARKAAGDHRRPAQQARRQGGVLAAAALAVIVVADGDPPDAVRL